jgi:pimeloyl-ACP methyl ester carboxylesterase
MTLLNTNGMEIHFTDQGTGDGVVLVHGFAASAQENWVKAGWVSMLARANRRVITIDLRGHGQSAKSYEANDYSLALMAGDVIAVVEHLQVKKPDLIGFSLGARVAIEVLRQRGDRFLLGVLCGVGAKLLDPRSESQSAAFAETMESESESGTGDDLAKRFRQFAEGQGQDLKALACVMRSMNRAGMPWTPEMLAQIRNEVLVIAGIGDELAGSAASLAAKFSNAKGKQIPGCGHMDCLTQPMFKAGVMDFLSGIPD